MRIRNQKFKFCETAPWLRGGGKKIERGLALDSRLTNGCAWDAASAFANCFVIPKNADATPLMLQTAVRLLLLFASGNGRYCGLAIVAEIGEGIFDASHFLDAPTFGPALLLYVRAACFSSRRDLGQSCLAHVGKVCDMLLEASGNAEVSWFDVGAGFFDILRAGT
jgi:hypothetical protein